MILLLNMFFLSAFDLAMPCMVYRWPKRIVATLDLKRLIPTLRSFGDKIHDKMNDTDNKHRFLNIGSRARIDRITCQHFPCDHGDRSSSG